MLGFHGMFNNPRDLGLTRNNVHVWCSSLQQSTDVVTQLSNLLSPEEKERASRFQFEHLRWSFSVARGTLRLILARYLELEPSKIQFRYTANGKPYLSDPHDSKGISFNLSHSGDLVLYAITRGRQLGVDIEQIRPVPELMAIAANTFSQEEYSQLKAVAEHQKLDAFFNCWTRKEAFIKAIGEGVSFPLDQFDVSLAVGRPARLLRIRGNKEDAACWSMFGWQPAEGYVAALAVEGTDCSVTYREWNHKERVQSTQEPR